MLLEREVLIITIANPEKYVAGLYERLSNENIEVGNGEVIVSNEDERESGSISTQKLFLRNFCKENNIRVFDDYTDDGFSGATFDRPDFNRMIKDIENKKINLIIVKDLSRFGRLSSKISYYLEEFFIEKGVTYTDMYTGYEFQATNGWRILDGGILNDDRTYSAVKLISTGIPAKLRYRMLSYENNEWWGNDKQVEELYGNQYVGSYTVNPGTYMAAGLVKNFTSIPFTAGTTASNNGGYFIKINSTDSGKLAEDAFLARGASEVHNVTLAEINKARGLGSTDKTTMEIKDADTGLFYLRNLANEDTNYSYNEDTLLQYWIATPSDEKIISMFEVEGNWSTNDQTFEFGVRPIIILNSKIQKVSEGHWKIVE